MSKAGNRTARGSWSDSAIQARLKRIETLLAEITASGTKPLDISEAAAYLHQSRSHVYQLTSKGLIAHFKPNGKKIYFLPQDLNAYLLRNRRASAEEIESAADNHIVNHPTAAMVRFVRSETQCFVDAGRKPTRRERSDGEAERHKPESATAPGGSEVCHRFPDRQRQA
jgi:excisionase family DNA binding protein